MAEKKILPTKILDSGYTFKYEELEKYLLDIV